MDGRKFFREYYSKLALEGVIKAVFCGFIIGLSASFISAFIAYLLIRDGLVPSIVVGLVVTIASATVFYFRKFKPTTKMLAHRVDRLGLEERMITMLDLENDQSYVAMRQREDAKERLDSINSSHLRLTLFKRPIIAVGCLFVLAAAMTIISSLTAKDIVPWNPRAIAGAEGTVYELVYQSSEGGKLIGETIQQVLYGESSSVVVPVADDGYMFDSWSDGRLDAERIDEGVRSDMSVTALFIELNEQTPAAGVAPSADEEGQVLPADLEQAGNTPAPSDPNEGGGKGAGGKDEPTNQIIDGETYYRDYYEMYYMMAVAALESQQDLPPEIRELIETYFGIMV